jgi:hypothetical protein
MQSCTQAGGVKKSILYVSQKFLIISWGEYLGRNLFIVAEKGLGKTIRAFFDIPIELVGVQSLLSLLNIIDLLLLRCTPEVFVSLNTRVAKQLNSFADQIILPQGTHISTALKRHEVANQCVANSVIKEIDLFAFF